jgi:hypothetical protein
MQSANADKLNANYAFRLIRSSDLRKRHNLDQGIDESILTIRYKYA